MCRQIVLHAPQSPLEPRFWSLHAEEASQIERSILTRPPFKGFHRPHDPLLPVFQPMQPHTKLPNAPRINNRRQVEQTLCLLDPLPSPSSFSLPYLLAPCKGDLVPVNRYTTSKNKDTISWLVEAQMLLRRIGARTWQARPDGCVFSSRALSGSLPF